MNRTVDVIWQSYYNLLLTDFLELLSFAARDTAVPAHVRNKILAVRFCCRGRCRRNSRVNDPPYPFPYLPPPVAEIAADLFKATLTLTVKLPFNWLAHVDQVFSRYDGQIRWRLDETYDLLRTGRFARLRTLADLLPVICGPWPRSLTRAKTAS